MGLTAVELSCAEGEIVVAAPNRNPDMWPVASRYVDFASQFTITEVLIELHYICHQVTESLLRS